MDDGEAMAHDRGNRRAGNRMKGKVTVIVSVTVGLLGLVVLGQTGAAAPYEPIERYRALVGFRVGQAKVLFMMTEKAWQRDKITALQYQSMNTWWNLIDIASSLVTKMDTTRSLCKIQMEVMRNGRPRSCGSWGDLTLYEQQARQIVSTYEKMIADAKRFKIIRDEQELQSTAPAATEAAPEPPAPTASKPVRR